MAAPRFITELACRAGVYGIVSNMAKPSPEIVEVECPCCGATLRIDPEVRAVVSHKEKEKPRPIEDLGAAVQRLKGESSRREEVFQRQMAEQKSHQQVLSRKFDELLRQAKEAPDLTPRKKDIDLD
jgi:hypothetical protein